MADISSFKSSGLLDDAAGQKAKKAAAAMPSLPGKPTITPPPAEIIVPPELPEAPSATTEIAEIEITRIRRSPFQVRAMGDAAYIDKLAESIRESGVISPVVVRPVKPANEAERINFIQYEFVAGEHRALACQQLGRNKVPAVVRSYTDAEAAKALGTDNAVRKDLDDYDRFKHFKMLMDNGFCKTDRDAMRTMGLAETFGPQLKSYQYFPEAATAILEKNPGLLGASYAQKVFLLAKEHPELFVRGIEKLAERKLKPSFLKAWLLSELAPAGVMPNRETLTVEKEGYPKFTIVVTDDEAHIKLAGINHARLRDLIETHLVELTDIISA
jgi:ParB/RepB/Spo0J family partition protein